MTIWEEWTEMSWISRDSAQEEGLPPTPTPTKLLTTPSTPHNSSSSRSSCTPPSSTTVATFTATQTWPGLQLRQLQPKLPQQPRPLPLQQLNNSNSMASG